MRVPNWLGPVLGASLAVCLIAIAGVQAYSERGKPLVQAHGTTYYNGDGPAPAPVICKPKDTILAAITQVHAKYDYLADGDLQSFLDRARDLKGLPPLDVDELYVITEDDKLRDGEMVLFIGLKVKCVTTVFGFSAAIYHELLGKGAGA